jgi:hypothetical protein
MRYNQRDGHNFTIGNFCTYTGLMVKVSSGCIGQYEGCDNPSGVHENSFADADLSTHIVATFFMDIN